MRIRGVWLPIVTPFLQGEVDFESYQSLIEHYVASGIRGIIPLGTTGESPVVTWKESQKIIEKTVEVVNGRLPVFIGIGGNDTAHVISKAKQVQSLGVEGVLSVCPYYSRPGQDGLYRHFEAIATATSLEILIYNIPYRTGVNLENETLFRLAEIENIIGVKDSCGDIRQSLALLSNKPQGFSVLTGEDHLFLTTLAHGGDGGILASAHLETKGFVDLFDQMMNNDINRARSSWRRIEKIIPLLFEEANPGPLKYCLYRNGLINSCEMRLPMTSISNKLKLKIDAVMSPV